MGLWRPIRLVAKGVFNAKVDAVYCDSRRIAPALMLSSAQIPFSIRRSPGRFIL